MFKIQTNILENVQRIQYSLELSHGMVSFSLFQYFVLYMSKKLDIRAYYSINIFTQLPNVERIVQLVRVLQRCFTITYCIRSKSKGIYRLCDILSTNIKSKLFTNKCIRMATILPDVSAATVTTVPVDLLSCGGVYTVYGGSIVIIVKDAGAVNW